MRDRLNAGFAAATARPSFATDDAHEDALALRASDPAAFARLPSATKIAVSLYGRAKAAHEAGRR